MNGGMPAAAANGSRDADALHVVHGVLSMDLGGLERLVLALIDSGRRRGYRNSIVCVDRPGQLADDARALGADVHCLNADADRALALPRARELLGLLDADVLHTHQIGALWHLGRAAAEASPRTTLIHTEHSDHATLARGLPQQIKSRLWWHRAGRLPQRFCCVSEDIAASVRRWRTVPAHKVTVVRNGIDVDTFADRAPRRQVRRELGLPDDAFVIGTVGRLNEVKRQDLLLRAFSAIAAQHPQAWLLIVGDGPERPALAALAGELGIGARTVFAGYQSRTERFLAAMDAFALTSRHEGLPLALLEAWASGLPVVSSAVGGIVRVVRDEANGLLFDSGDIAGLARALSRLIDDNALRDALARQGHDDARAHYSLDRMADDYDRHYRNAMTQIRSRRSA